MKLSRDKTSFGRHETFPLRYGWLTKGYELARDEPGIFAEPERAMVALGVGRNMVNAIQYWLRAAGIALIDHQRAETTSLGQVLFGPDGDPYLEDDATLWIVHWLIASNAAEATGFFWFFNRFAMPRFRDQDVIGALADFVSRELGSARSRSTLKSDAGTLLRMYVVVEGRTDEHLDTPLAQLGLVEPDPEAGYRSLRTNRPFLPPVALHFALAQRFFAEPQQPALPVRAVLYSDDGWPAVGATFRLSEEGLMSALERVMDQFPDSYELRDSAGVHQIYRRGKLIDPLDILREYYRTRTQ